MNTTISFLTQDETKRLFAAIPSKRDRALFLTAYRHGYGQRSWTYADSFFVGGSAAGTVSGGASDS